MLEAEPPSRDAASPPDPAAILDGLPRRVAELQKRIGAVVVGQGNAVDLVLYAL